MSILFASRVPNQVLPIISSPTQVTAKKTQLQNPFSTPKSQQKGILSVLLRAWNYFPWRMQISRGRGPGLVPVYFL